MLLAACREWGPPALHFHPLPITQLFRKFAMNIFVGNLAATVEETDLEPLFKQCGQVKSVRVNRDQFTGDSRGFAFVEMPGKAEAQAAITSLNGKELKGQLMKVNEARPKPSSGARTPHRSISRRR
jgi:RNA recognition motif-containing protein